MSFAQPVNFLEPAYGERVPARPANMPYFFSLRPEQTIASVLQLPYKFFFEAGGHALAGNSVALLFAESPDMALSVTTHTAYYGNIAYHIAEALNIRFGLQDYKCLQIATCLQETCINAVVHGNLELGSQFRNSQEFAAHYHLIEERLRQAPYKSRHVHIAAWDCGDYLKLSVSDQGTGFSLPAASPDSGKPHGRGLFLIQSLADSVWMGADRRTLFMTFAY